MSLERLRSRPDLSPIFGPMQREDREKILDELLKIDESLVLLAEVASAHAGVRYRHIPLDFHWGVAGAEISGGPSGDAGDIWFELDTWDQYYENRQPPLWTVRSNIIVFCVDPQYGEDPNTHVLAGRVAEAKTPAEAVATLAARVAILRGEILRRSASEFTQSTHAELVAWEAAQGRA